MHASDIDRIWHALGRLDAHLGVEPGCWSVPVSRAGRVRSALSASRHTARTMIVEQLAGIDLSAVWDLLVSACQDIALYYGGCTVLGTAIGGIGGAFAGGAGALPGAAAGAAAGAQVGGWVMGLLGLASLAESLANAVPDALRCYAKGFREAWGATGQERAGSPFGFDTGTGNIDRASFLFANGHVLMIMAILTALTAYLTRGHDRAVLLHEVRKSQRLGPRMAAWLEQNEERLRQMPALQSRRNGAPPASQPQSRNEPDALRMSKSMPRAKVPCFRSNDLPKTKIREFDRQLAGQEKGINNLTVDEYIQGRRAFAGKSIYRDPGIARAAREEHALALKRKLTTSFLKKGFSPALADIEAAKAAAEQMATLAALHNPDMVSAGKDVISDFGDRNVNARIGAQWRSRVEELDKAAERVPLALRDSIRMNAKLERCK